MTIPASNPLKPLWSPAKLVRLYPSKFWLWGILGVHLMAVMAVLSSAALLFLKASSVLFVLFSACLCIRQWRAQAIFRVQYLQGDWYLLTDVSLTQCGERQAYKILTWSFWSVWLIVLVLEGGQGKRTYLPLMFDCCQPEEFRWFRVLVKYLLPSEHDHK